MLGLTLRMAHHRANFDASPMMTQFQQRIVQVKRQFRLAEFFPVFLQQLVVTMLHVVDTPCCLRQKWHHISSDEKKSRGSGRAGQISFVSLIIWDA